MKYLRKFETEAEYSAFTKGEYVSPNVSLVTETKAVKYNVEFGVFIQHIDGQLYSVDKWAAKGFANAEANGVAVRTAECAFVIAKTDTSSNEQWSSNASELIGGATLATTASEARADYAGLANTAAIAAVSTSGAAVACMDYIFPNGAIGYFPARGEAEIAFANKAAIDAAMTLIGGTKLTDADYYSTSTQASATHIWVFYWGTSYIGTYGKNGFHFVRPFTTL